MDKLFDRYEVAVVGFDVVFAERDESSGLKVLEGMARDELKGDEDFLLALERVRPELSYDNLFVESVAGRPVILGYYFSVKTGDAEVLRTGRPLASTTA